MAQQRPTPIGDISLSVWPGDLSAWSSPSRVQSVFEEGVQRRARSCVRVISCRKEPVNQLKCLSSLIDRHNYFNWFSLSDWSCLFLCIRCHKWRIITRQLQSIIDRIISWRGLGHLLSIRSRSKRKFKMSSYTIKFDLIRSADIIIIIINILQVCILGISDFNPGGYNWQ